MPLIGVFIINILNPNCNKNLRILVESDIFSLSVTKEKTFTVSQWGTLSPLAAHSLINCMLVIRDSAALLRMSQGLRHNDVLADHLAGVVQHPLLLCRQFQHNDVLDAVLPNPAGNATVDPLLAVLPL